MSEQRAPAIEPADDSDGQSDLPDGMVRADEIQWVPFRDSLPPDEVPSVADDDWARMSEEDLLTRALADGEAVALSYIRDLHRENSTQREMLSVAMEQVTHLSAHLEAARRTITAQRAELRRSTA